MSDPRPTRRPESQPAGWARLLAVWLLAALASICMWRLISPRLTLPAWTVALAPAALQGFMIGGLTRWRPRAIWVLLCLGWIISGLAGDVLTFQAGLQRQLDIGLRQLHESRARAALIASIQARSAAPPTTGQPEAPVGVNGSAEPVEAATDDGSSGPPPTGAVDQPSGDEGQWLTHWAIVFDVYWSHRRGNVGPLVAALAASAIGAIGAFRMTRRDPTPTSA